MSMADGAQAATITLEDLEAGYHRMIEEDHRRSQERAERYVRFMESIPEGLRNDEFVIAYASVIAEQVPVHPVDAAKAHRTLLTKVAEHEAKMRGEHPSGLWVPPPTTT